MLRSSLCTASRSTALAATVLASAAAAATPAFARGGPGRGGGDRPEVRVAGVCDAGASSKLRLRGRDGGIKMEFEVHGRSGTWNVTIVHERNVAWRGKRRPSGPSRSFSVEYRLPDWEGADVVTARARGPRGGVCTATATLPG
jgi:hypothetical protein